MQHRTGSGVPRDRSVTMAAPVVVPQVLQITPPQPVRDPPIMVIDHRHTTVICRKMKQPFLGVETGSTQRRLRLLNYGDRQSTTGQLRKGPSQLLLASMVAALCVSDRPAVPGGESWFPEPRTSSEPPQTKLGSQCIAHHTNEIGNRSGALIDWPDSVEALQGTGTSDIDHLNMEPQRISHLCDSATDDNAGMRTFCNELNYVALDSNEAVSANSREYDSGTTSAISVCCSACPIQSAARKPRPL